MVELTILGTASMVPTKERNPQAFYLEFEGEGMLFDCAEGTQRQMQFAGLSRAKIRRIFITHWHGDHVAGLIGLIQTIGNSGYEETLHIYGPYGTKEHMFHLMNATVFENKISIKVHELAPPDEEEFPVVDEERYQVTCIPADHGVPTLAYAWIEKEKTRIDMAAAKRLGLKEGPHIGKLSRGESVEVDGKRISPNDVTYRTPSKRIVFIPDTQPHPNLIRIARNADLLICESTFGDEEQEKAQQFRHMTARAAAQVASRAEVKRLLLTHFSQRYPTVGHLVDQAREHFQHTDAAHDLMQITL